MQLVVLVQVRTSAKALCQWASRCGETSRNGLRDLVASGTKCGLHGGKNGKTKSCTVPWLSLKAKIESENVRAKS
jgi:hypothetical protein